MILSLSVWLMICQLKGLALGYCLYGDDPNSAFQCHCAVDNECGGGTCPSGCDTSLPSGYNWRGSSCQIGIVGLHKSTNMTAPYFYQKTYPATGALDESRNLIHILDRWVFALSTIIFFMLFCVSRPNSGEACQHEVIATDLDKITESTSSNTERNKSDEKKVTVMDSSA
ncbi:hypothetical protein LSH36_2230g00006 [Paralvinella palmiformis]|uniref:Uncharacterized protein n=1 Tax=Paralvinella palmiformis TaxID=53620 RepID=A0AAD9IQB9_9ANNE|nr:hypothetical protein LSH36_2230g00006 [Paralvinella palmiformis]